jgi:hypothetical protein
MVVIRCGIFRLLAKKAPKKQKRKNMSKPKQAAQPRFEDPFLTPDTNLDLSGCPSFRELSSEDETSDPFLGGDWAKLTAENRDSLKTGVIALANLRDPEIRSHLKGLGIEDPTESRDFFLASGEQAKAYLGDDGVWRVTIFFENGTQKTYKFENAASRESAQIMAARHVARTVVNVKKLSKSQELDVIRMCQVGKIQDAIVNFLFFSLGEIDTDPLNDPRYLPVCNQAVWFCFIHSTPDYTPDAKPFMEKFLAGREALTVHLLQIAFKRFQEDQKRITLLPRNGEQDTQIQNSEIDLESLSDEEISRLREDSLRAYAKQGRR